MQERSLESFLDWKEYKKIKRLKINIYPIFWKMEMLYKFYHFIFESKMSTVNG
jgi:hypothetical protein